MDAKTRDTLLAASLRQAAKALSDAAAIIDGNLPGADRARNIIGLLRALDVGEKNGFNRADASRLCRENGINPRAFGGLVSRGLIVRKGDKRFTSAAGRAWLHEQEKLTG